MQKEICASKINVSQDVKPDHIDRHREKPVVETYLSGASFIYKKIVKKIFFVEKRNILY